MLKSAVVFDFYPENQKKIWGKRLKNCLNGRGVVKDEWENGL